MIKTKTRASRLAASRSAIFLIRNEIFELMRAAVSGPDGKEIVLSMGW